MHFVFFLSHVYLAYCRYLAVFLDDHRKNGLDVELSQALNGSFAVSYVGPSAARAGVKVGDWVLAVSGQPLDPGCSPQVLAKLLETSAKPLALGLERGPPSNSSRAGNAVDATTSSYLPHSAARLSSSALVSPPTSSSSLSSSSLSSLDLSVNLVQGSLLLLHGGALFSFARLDQVAASLRLGAACNQSKDAGNSYNSSSHSGSTSGDGHGNTSNGGDLSVTATMQAAHLLDLTPQGAKHRDVIRPPSHQHVDLHSNDSKDRDGDGIASSGGTENGLHDSREKAAREDSHSERRENSNNHSRSSTPPEAVVNAPPMVALDFKRSASNGTSSLKAKVSDLTACICGRFGNEMAAYLKHRPIQARLKQLERDGKEAAAAAKALHRHARRNSSHATTTSRVASSKVRQQRARMRGGGNRNTSGGSSGGGKSGSGSDARQSSASSSSSSSSEESIQADEEPNAEEASRLRRSGATQEASTEGLASSSTPTQEPTPKRPAPLQFFLEVFRLEAVLPRNSSSVEATALLVDKAVIQSVPNLRGIDTWDLASLTSENVAAMLGVAASAATRKGKTTPTRAATPAAVETTSDAPQQQQQQQHQQQPSAHPRDDSSSHPLASPSRRTAKSISSRHRSRSPKRRSKTPPPSRRSSSAAAAAAAAAASAAEDLTTEEVEDAFEDARATHSDDSSGDDAFFDASSVAHPESSRQGKLSSPRASNRSSRSDHRRTRKPMSPKRHSPSSEAGRHSAGFSADSAAVSQEDSNGETNEHNANNGYNEEMLLQQQAKEDEDLLAGAGVNVEMVESAMGRISVMLHRVRLFSATKAALNDDLDRTELHRCEDDEDNAMDEAVYQGASPPPSLGDLCGDNKQQHDNADKVRSNNRTSSSKKKSSTSRSTWFAVSAFDEVPIAMVAPRKPVYALPQSSEDLTDVHQPNASTSSNSGGSAAAVDAAAHALLDASTMPTSRKAAMKLKAKAEAARKRKVRQDEAQGRNERCERVTCLEWHAVLHGDLGVIVDQGLSRPRILLCSPQPHARSCTNGDLGGGSNGSNSSSASPSAPPLQKGARAVDLGIESGRDEDVIGCPHIDLSMAQFYLAMSVWWDNLAEQAEFIDYAPTSQANDEGDASTTAAPGDGAAREDGGGIEDDDGEGEDGQEAQVNQGLEVDDDDDVPTLPSTRQEWGYWPQVFASPEWLDKWRSLRWGWEFCVFFPAVRIDASMETAYFPEPPPSLACVLNAAGNDVKLPVALKQAYLEHNARARAVREEAAAAAQRSFSSSSRRGDTGDLPGMSTKGREAGVGADTGLSPHSLSHSEGLVERRLPSVVPFLQLEGTGVRVHFVGGGRKPQLPVVEAAEPFFNIKPRCMLITISMTDLDLIDCRRPLGAPPPASPFARGIGTRSAKSFPTSLERYVIRARNEHTRAAAKLFDPKKSRQSHHTNSNHHHHHHPSTASSSPSSQPSTPSPEGTATAAGAQLAGGGGGDEGTEGNNPACCPACLDPDRLLACLWPCSEHGSSPCARRPWDSAVAGDPRAADPMAPTATPSSFSSSSGATLLRRMSRFVEPVGVSR